MPHAYTDLPWVFWVYFSTGCDNGCDHRTWGNWEVVEEPNDPTGVFVMFRLIGWGHRPLDRPIILRATQRRELAWASAPIGPPR